MSQDPSTPATLSPTNIGVAGMLILLILDKFAFWFHKIVQNRRNQGKDPLQRPRCADDPKFSQYIKHFEETHDTKIAIGDMKNDISKLKDEAIKQTGILREIAKNSSGSKRYK